MSRPAPQPLEVIVTLPYLEERDPRWRWLATDGRRYAYGPTAEHARRELETVPTTPEGAPT